MDNSSDTLYVDFSGSNDRVKHFLSYLASLKGLRIVPLSLGRPRSPAISFMGLAVDGLPAITELLMEAKPAPDVLPSDPRRRALIRNFVGMILLEEIDLRDLEVVYKDKVLTTTNVNMLDLALAACAKVDLADELKWINKVGSTVQAAITAQSAMNSDRRPELKLA